ncbi:SlyX protein [Opitutaceae bacterium TAV1]|nr:SlyX protein [Opitutaceae bacterium TAV1]
MSNERLDILEERIAWLQRHVVEQDKVMLGQARELERLRAELTRVIERLPDDSGPSPAGQQERPPHY